MELSSETRKTTLGRLAATALKDKAKSAHKEKINLRFDVGFGRSDKGVYVSVNEVF